MTQNTTSSPLKKFNIINSILTDKGQIRIPKNSTSIPYKQARAKLDFHSIQEAEI